MKKRILASVFAVVCLFSLTSCFGQGTQNPAPTAVAVTPPSESEIISYFKHFDIDILTAEKAALENKITIRLENENAYSDMSTSIKLRSRSQNGSLTAICETAGNAFNTNTDSPALSYYDGTAAYYQSDKTKAEMTAEEFKKSAYIIPFIIENITEDGLKELKGLELEGVITYYFTLNPEAADFSSMFANTQFSVSEDVSVSIEMSQGNPQTLTVSATGTYVNAERKEYSAVISVSVQPLQFEDFSLPDNLTEYQDKNA